MKPFETNLLSATTACRAVSLINCHVPMRDGVNLSIDVYLPPDKLGQPLPCIMGFSPYGASASRSEWGIDYAVKHGFAVINADCRGRFNSEGNFHPWDETIVNDAYDLLDWISKQPWCNGRLAMVGGSYPGNTQLACLRSGHPLLTVCAPSAVTLNPYPIYYAGGALVLKFVASWHIGICSRTPAPKGHMTFDEACKNFPINDIPESMGLPCPSWVDSAKNSWYNEFWKTKSALRELEKSTAGIFYQGSWFDMLGVDTFETFKALRETVTPETAQSNRRFSCLRVGPWGHGINMHEGEIDYGPESMVSEDQEANFLQSLIDGKTPKSAFDPSPIQIFVMGRNKWRFENEWPLARTDYRDLFLGGSGAANTACGDGTLSFEKPVNAAADHFIFNPTQPVPTCGGRIVGGGGQCNQAEIEKRSDVLVYTSDAIKNELEVTGRISAVLYVTSSATDTDFTVKLVDVFPDGRPMSVCDGIICTRLRDGTDKPPRPMKAGEHVRLEFFVDITSYCFMPEHCIRVEISSSNFPHFAPNPNTGAQSSSGAKWEIASQTVFHSAEEPSHLILPVIQN